MDLKTKLMIQAGINEDIALHIIKSLPIAKQKQLCLLDPVQLMQQIPDLMRDANCLDEFEMDPSFQKPAPPKPRTDHLLKTNKLPMPSSAIELNDEEESSESSVKKYLLYIIFGVACFGLISSFLPDEKVENQKTKAKKQKMTKAKPKPLEKAIPSTSSNSPTEKLPELPSRGSWMFSPNATYNSLIECKDQRFKHFNVDYTIELWFKASEAIDSEINLIELYENNLPIERLFLNNEGQLCFSAGPGSPSLKYKKAIPHNGKHYHLAVCKAGEKFTMFINGKIRQSFSMQTKFPKSRSGIQLLRSMNKTNNLAIDEVRVSSEAIYNKNFIPNRTLSISAITELYMPLEKNAENVLKFYGINHDTKSKPLTGGKWLNIIYETQVISNELEQLRSSNKN